MPFPKPHSPRPLPIAGRFVLFFALIFLVTGGFSLIHPMAGNPDENAHQRYAFAVVTGQLPVGADQVVMVPSWLAAEGPECWRFNPGTPATCAVEQDPMSGHNGELVPAITQAANYPPLYYAIIGLPLRLFQHGDFSGHIAIRLSRLMSSAMFSLLAATALCAFAGRRPMTAESVLAGWLIVPSATVISAAINPQSLEIGAALLFAGAAWPMIRDSNVSPARFWTMGVASALLIQSRPSGVIWAALLSAMLAIALWGRIRTILHKRAFWGFIALSALSSIIFLIQRRFSVNTAAYADTHGLPGCGVRCVAEHLGENAGVFSRQTIAVTGWLDTDLPPAAAYSGLVVIGIALVVGLIAGPTRRRVAIAVGTLAIPGSALLIESATVAEAGYLWQARYALPLVIPVLWLSVMSCAPPRARTADASGRIPSRRPWAFAAGAGVMASIYALFGLIAAQRFWVGLGSDAPLWPTLPRAAALGLGIYELAVGLALALSLLMIFTKSRSGMSNPRPAA